MKLFYVCLSSAVAAFAIKTSAVSAAGADVAALFNRKTNLNEEGEQQLQADPRRLSSNTPVTCKENITTEATERTATFSEKTLQASFTCGAGYTELIPACTKDTLKCCENPQCTKDGADIATVLGVKGKAVKSDQTYTVTLERIPDNKRGQKIYYKCKKSDSDVCLVALALPKIEPNVCAIDKVLTYSLGKANSSASFKCPDGTMNLKPFEVSKGTCTETQKETSAVTLAGVSTGTGEYELTVDQLPNQTEQLCYTCTYSEVPSVDDLNHKTPRTCSVIVTVEAAASSTSTATTTSSARSILMTSGAMNVVIAMLLTVGFFNWLAVPSSFTPVVMSFSFSSSGEDVTARSSFAFLFFSSEVSLSVEEEENERGRTTEACLFFFSSSSSSPLRSDLSCIFCCLQKLSFLETAGDRKSSLSSSWSSSWKSSELR
ncbi:srs domain-containing protein [Cystoisospora suis]|uniref:Srs domain-containing protein n=1 Tax=Cystoisospora suis TaxID=483139 RepID=A0A2C6KEA0_9APIC|nr:srs domain-containing protein [Cystoisospora suis]